MLEQRDGEQEESKVMLEVQTCEGLRHLEPFVGHNGQRWHVQSVLLRRTVLR